MCPDHVHMFEIPPKYLRFKFRGIPEREEQSGAVRKVPELKYKIPEPGEFWCRGYYVDTAGRTRNGSRSTSSTSWMKTRWRSR